VAHLVEALFSLHNLLDVEARTGPSAPRTPRTHALHATPPFEHALFPAVRGTTPPSALIVSRAAPVQVFCFALNPSDGSDVRINVERSSQAPPAPRRH